MAAFFSLGAGGASTGREATTSVQNQPPPHIPPAVIGNSEPINPWANPSVVLYRNEEIYQKGFEIWQQYVQVHHHHHPAASLYQHLGDSTGSGSGSGVAATATGTRSLPFRAAGGMRTGGGGGINCQDCGNQAKKDCAHLRCRTCCKSRGFECATHVKSTWVPAAKRRERQQQLAALNQQQQYQNNTDQQQSQRELIMRSSGGPGEKRHREARSIVLPCTRVAAAGASTASEAGLEVGQHFPSEVSSPAVFRCVRVSSVDHAEELLAYQTAVSIAGHVFKGILYDQGPVDSAAAGGSGGVDVDLESPRGSSGALQQHNLLSGIGIGIGIGIGTGTAEETAEAATGGQMHGGGSQQQQQQQLLDHPAMYPTPINAFLAGTQFFPPPRT